MRIKFLTEDNQIKSNVNAVIHDYEVTNTLVVSTSGSTGLPKEIIHSKAALEFSARNTIEYFNWNTGTKALLCLSTNTIGGKMMIIRSIIANSELLIGDVVKDPLQKIEEQIDFIAIVPYQLEAMLETSLDKLKRIPKILVGGGAINEELEKKLIAHQITVVQSFGMTETISHIALKKVGYAATASFEVLPGIEISSENDQLVIHSNGLNIDNLQTNDFVRIIDANHFEWIGRSDFVINSGGVKIHPEVVEKKLKDLIQNPFYISSVPHNQLGEQVILVINSNSCIISKNDLIARLTKYEIPKMIFCLPDFIWTDSGKINRIKTNELLEDGVRTLL